MALIGKIRENSWFLIVLLVLGMGGFLFMDMIGGSRGSSIMGNQNMVAKIEGEKIRIDQFLEREQNYYGGSPGGDVYQRRESFFNYWVQESVLETEKAEIGLDISAAEMTELLLGPNYSPVVQQELGQNLSLVSQYLENLDQLPPGSRASWREFEDRVANDKMKTKLSTLVSKSLYTPSWMAEELNKNRQSTMEVAVVTVPFSSLDNSGIEVSEKEISDYIAENRAVYEVDEPTRTVEYVTFDVSPTGKDSTEIEAKVAGMIAEWQNEEDDSTFIVDNYGEYFTEYRGEDEYSEVIADSLLKVEPGTIIGPYLDGGEGQYVDYGFYKATKLVDRKVVPDSVEARHIFIPVTNAKFDRVALERGRKTADSIYQLLTVEGIPFDTLARDHSRDVSTSNSGGNIGTLNSKGQGGLSQSVDVVIRDHIFYEAQPNQVDIVVSSIGVHLVEVLRSISSGKIGMRTATVSEVIVPSQSTQGKIYNQAFSFISTNRKIDQMTQAALEQEMDKRTAAGLIRNGFDITGLGTGEPSRNLIKWAFTADEGEVSPEIYTYEDPVEFFNTKYVIAALVSKSPAGLPKAADLRDEIEPILINRKSGEKAASALQGSSLSQIAEQYNVQVDTLNNVAFDGGFNTLSSEPEVLGEVAKLDSGQTSTVLVGNNGIYMVQVLAKTEPGAADVLAIRQTESSKLNSQLTNPFSPSNPLIEALIDRADITDNRSRFF